jgi:putative N6-adenine-specific DNA methylase
MPTIATPPRPALDHEVDCFAVSAPGLEPLVHAELMALGIEGVAEPGGVAWRGPLDTVARANLWLRIASRVIVRLGEFRARTFFELERRARRLPWERFVRAGSPVTFRVTCRKSKLYHTEAVIQRLAEALERRVGASSRYATADEADDESEPGARGDQLFIARVFKDVCTVSADSSGSLLHLRGYRQAVAKAPLRETLASALLAASAWDGSAPLLDPMCGSGTIPIEAAMLARRIAPGLRRRFAFTEWPTLARATWASMREAAEREILPAAPAIIQGSDRDAGAVGAARANAERAGVAGDVEFTLRAISAIEPPRTIGALVTNPPYGIRLGDIDALRGLYAQFGHVARMKCPGWRIGLLSADPRLDGQLRLPLDERFRTTNGGIPVRALIGVID